MERESRIGIGCIVVAFVAATGWTTSMADDIHDGLVDHPTDRVLHLEKIVRASLDDVWRAWTTEEGVTAFAPPAAKIDLRVGGAYEWYFILDAPEGQRGAEGCRVLSYVPKQSLAFTWNAPPKISELRSAGARTQVHVTMAPAGRGRVRVTLTQFGYGEGDAWNQYYDYFEKAWASVLDALAAHFEKERSAEKSPDLKSYVYFIEPVRKTFEQDATPEEIAIIGRHFQYLKNKHEAGELILAGRTQDEKPPFGIVVFEAASDEEAENVFHGDPAVKAGVFKGSVRRYGVALSR